MWACRPLDGGPQFGDGAGRLRVHPPQMRALGPEDGKFGVGCGPYRCPLNGDGPNRTYFGSRPPAARSLMS